MGGQLEHDDPVLPAPLIVGVIHVLHGAVHEQQPPLRLVRLRLSSRDDSTGGAGVLLKEPQIERERLHIQCGVRRSQG